MRDVSPARSGQQRSLLCMIAALCAIGCQEQTYRSETVLNADGSVARAIYQPRDETPDDVRESSTWSRVTASAERPAERWTLPIAELPDEPDDDKHPYFVAVGTFSGPEKLPAHFLVKAPEGINDGQLKNEVSRNDFLFVIEHHWLETLTDSIALPDVPVAAAEIAEFSGEVLARLLERELGAEYDVDPVREWARKEGRQWITAVALTYYEAGLQHELHDDARIQRRLAAASLPFGLEFIDKSGQMLDAAGCEKEVYNFLRRWLEKYCRHRSGAPDRKKLDELVDALHAADRDENAEKRESGRRLKDEMDKIAIELCGGEEAFQKRVWGLSARLTGLYAFRILNPPRRFHYSLKVPGRILSTNGNRVGQNGIEWSFQDVDAFPLGYRMECRTLVADLETQKRLLKTRPLNTLDSQREFIRLASADPDLTTALRACRKTGDLAPLERYRDAHDEESLARKQYHALWSLLKPEERNAAETAQ